MSKDLKTCVAEYRQFRQAKPKESGWQYNDSDCTNEICDAYIAEHLPDDDEPVTAEWAISNGWWLAAFGVFYGHDAHKSLLLQGRDGNWSLQLGLIEIAINPTRGQVRRLIAAVESPGS